METEADAAAGWRKLIQSPHFKTGLKVGLPLAINLDLSAFPRTFRSSFCSLATTGALDFVFGVVLHSFDHPTLNNALLDI